MINNNILFKIKLKKLKLNKSIGFFSFIALVIIVYKLLLEYIYSSYISKNWLFMGFFEKFNINNYMISWIILLLFLPLIIRNLNLKKISSLFLSLFNIIIFIPCLVLIGLYGYSKTEYLITLILYWFNLNFFNLIIPDFRFNRLQIEGDLILKIFELITVFSIIYVSYKYVGFRVDLNIMNAYKYRYESNEYNINNILSYLFAISRNIFPIFITIKLINKNYVKSFFYFFVGILAYSVDGSKSTLFAYIMVFLGFLFYKSNKIKFIPVYMVVLVGFSILEIILSKKSFIIDIFIRRVSFIPSLLTHYYFDFFSSNPFDYFRQGLIGRFGFRSAYNILIPDLIGNLYFLDSYANGGLYSDAYSNLGVIGTIIMPILLISCIRLYEEVSRGLDERIIFTGAITIIFSLINSSFFTVLITHGMATTIILFYFMNRDKINNKGEKYE